MSLRRKSVLYCPYVEGKFFIVPTERGRVLCCPYGDGDISVVSTKRESSFGDGLGGFADFAQLQVRSLDARKVDIRLPGKGNSNSYGARPFRLIITMIKWIQTSRLPRKNFLSLGVQGAGGVAKCRMPGSDQCLDEMGL